MPEFLDIKHLDAGYGRSQVLFDVTLGIPWRGGVAVLGRNGAGKTTLMKTIVGELPAWKGEVAFDGRDISRRATQERVRAGIGYVPQEHSVFARLSVRDNLAVGSLANKDASAIDRVLAIFPKLGQRLDQPAGTLSGGERKMLAIGRAMLGDPKLLLLDEPTEGVWIGVIEEITERLIEARQDHRRHHRRAAPRPRAARCGLRLCAGSRTGRAARRGGRGQGQSGADAVSGAVAPAARA